MAWLDKLINIIGENWEIVRNNIVLFLSYGVICVALTMVINKLLNKRKDEQIKRLEEQISQLEDKYESLKERFVIGQTAEMMIGAQASTNSDSAKAVSEHIKNK